MCRETTRLPDPLRCGTLLIRLEHELPGVCPTARRLPHPAGDFVQWLRHQRITDLLAGASTGDQPWAAEHNQVLCDRLALTDSSRLSNVADAGPRSATRRNTRR